MGNLRLKGKDLKKIGYTSETAKSLAINIITKHFKHSNKDETLKLLQSVIENPLAFIDDPSLGTLALFLTDKPKKNQAKLIKQVPNPRAYMVFGKEHITQETFLQMEQAMRLPIAMKGALMADAHVGYGLPIGSVYATKNEVVPYGVGMDIGCRMCLSVYMEGERFLNRYEYQAMGALKDNTHFGAKTDVKFRHDHEVLDRSEFLDIPFAKKLHGKAYRQLGTSGSGNHFVEFGLVEFGDKNSIGIEPGRYLGILSHSGSRGFGAEVAKAYTEIAMKQLKMPKGMQHMAWLDINSQEGSEYWALMNLAGDYAKACHEMIHSSISKSLGLTQLMKIENYHNFAWKEFLEDGEQYVIHRKGATPASEGTLGIIPGSMSQPGFLVKGLGFNNSMNSASHGAGRKVSRSRAKNTITVSELNKHLKQQKISLIGGSVDEAPFVYKDLNKVMKSQKNLVSIEGRFTPKIVRMDKN